MASNQTQRMYNPETGKFGDVPVEQVAKATADGLELATQLYNPQTKQTGWVPKSREKQALADGLELVEIPRSLTLKQQAQQQAQQQKEINAANEAATFKGATAGALEGLTFGLGKYPVGVGAYIADRLRGSKNPVSFDEALKLSEQEIASRKEAAPVAYGVGRAVGTVGSAVTGARALGVDKLLGQSATAQRVATGARDIATRIAASPEPIGEAVSIVTPVATRVAKAGGTFAAKRAKEALTGAAMSAGAGATGYAVDQATDGGVRQWFGSLLK